MKTCSKCKQCLPLAMFSRNKANRDGLEYLCGPCRRERDRIYRDSTKEQSAARSKRWRERHKERLAEERRQQYAADPERFRIYERRYKERNPGAQAKADRKHYEKNREALLAKDKALREANLEKYLARERASYARRREKKLAQQKLWREANKPIIAFHAANRRAILAQRTPPWLTDDDIAGIRQYYWYADLLTVSTGVAHHVDHIVPLNGETVSGLHVPWNMQVLPAIENIKKGNKHAAE